MARRLVSLVAAAVGVLILPHEAEGVHNVRKFTNHHVRNFEPSGQNNLLRALRPVQEAYYDQAVLDHNAPLAQQTYWKQRYLINQEYWGGKGYPVFFFNAGETPLPEGPLTNRSNAGQLAVKHKALLVGLEHRYYGKSIPTADLSTENLKYLTSEQQLADVARFHAFLTKSMGLETSKWIAFGGSYGGSLAAWEKLKYPTLFAGAVASSAPLQAKSNFLEFNEVVGRSLRFYGGDECYNRVEQGVVAFRKLVDGGNTTQSQLQTLFPACDPIQNVLDLSVYESEISFPFGDAAMYNGNGSPTVAQVCTLFANKTQTPLELLATFTRSRLSGPCFDSTFEGNANGNIEYLQNTTIGDPVDARQWFYQTCNEFGWYTTTTSPNSPFYALKSLTEEAIGLEMCRRLFDINVAPKVRNTNAVYGGLHPMVDNVTFVSGSIDPWSALSVTHAARLNSAVYIVGTAHATDVYAPSESNIPALKAAYAKIAANVATYLSA